MISPPKPIRDHGNLEVRPLAERVIDAMLAEDESRYDVYRLIQEESGRRGAERESGHRDVYREVGLFMTRWAEFENLVRTLTSTDGVVPVFRLLERLDFLDASLRGEIDLLRRLRNNVAHNKAAPSAAYLAEAAQRVESIVGEIRRRSSLHEQ